ncbi:hypothetical protein AB0E01_41540 [Nocardia vinacea]|uniref:hypothetical protein n=1 Tax=Nocardia vinacea TaxID=96468 RepID=UPI0033FB176D
MTTDIQEWERQLQRELGEIRSNSQQSPWRLLGCAAAANYEEYSSKMWLADPRLCRYARRPVLPVVGLNAEARNPG